MSLLVMSTDGEAEALRLFVSAELVVPRVWHLRLFSNDYTPHKFSVLADLTESAWAGYAPVLMDPDEWQPPVVMGDASVTYYRDAATTWLQTSGSAINNYGYFVTFANGTKLLYAERFDAVQVSSLATPVVVWPSITSQSKYEPDPPP